MTFTISPSTPFPETPTVAAIDGSGPYDGQPFAATGIATGLASAGVSGSFAFTYYVGSTVSGTGSTVAPTNSGTYTVVADFISSDPDYVDAESPPATFTISPATTTTTVSASASAERYGQTDTLTAVVASPTEGIPNGGTVTFMAGATSLGVAPVINGTATLPTRAIPAGLNIVTATYSGDGENFTGSSSVLSPSSVIETVAGNGTDGYTGDGGPGNLAELYNPNGIGVDAAGDLFIADSQNNVVREVNATTHIITTVVGTGTQGYNGDGIPATSAELYSPVAVAVDAQGDLFIADGERIREVNAATGLISTVAGTGVAGYNGDGIPATSAELFNPSSIAVDAAGDLFIDDYINQRVREVNAATGLISTVAGTGGAGYNGDGIAATSAELNFAYGIALDASGDLFIADTQNNLVREVNASTGLISTVAGTGGAGYNGDGIAATSAEVNFPLGVAVDAAGDLFIGDSMNQRIREVTAGVINTVAGTGAAGYNGDGIAAASADFGYDVSGVAVDAAGDLFINDQGNDRAREISSGATAVTVLQATPTVDVFDSNGPYTGNPFTATATTTGVGGASVNGTFAFTYYAGSTVNGTGSSTSPTNPGTYTVTAAFTSSDADYTNASGGPVTFTISQAGPTVTAPSAAALYENGSLAFSTGNGNAISVADNVALAKSDSLTLSVTHGALKLGSTSGLKFTSGSNNSSSMTVNGTLASLNAALQTLKYIPASSYIGPDVLSLTLSDAINQLSGSASVSLTVYGPPTLSAPATAGVNENGTLVFSSANGNAVTLADAAASASGTSDSLVLTITHGTLTLGSTAGLTFTAGSNGSASMTISGSLVNLNAALSGLQYTPKIGYSGSASLTIKAKDAASGFNSTATVAITVSIPPSQPTVVVNTDVPTSVPGEPVPLVFTVTDTNSTAEAATFSLVISFGDGKSATVSAADALLVNHVYTHTGTYTVSVTATDEYGHTSSAATTTVTVVPVAVETDPFDSSLTALFVGGTSGKDTITFTASGSQIAVTLNKVAEGTFSTNGPLIVFGQGGADVVTVSPGVTNTSYLLETPNADNAETDLDNEAIQWAGLSSAVEILNE